MVLGDLITVLCSESAPDTLLVLGTHDRGGFLPRFGWSLGVRLAGATRGPLAVVPEAAQSLPPGRVVVGVDDSPGVSTALDLAAREASRRREVLHLVHVWQEPLLPDDSSAIDPETLTALRRAHRRVLDEAVAAVRLAHPGLEVRSDLLRGEPAAVLVEADPGRGSSWSGPAGGQA